MTATESTNLHLLEVSASTFWEAHIPEQGNGIHILYVFAVDGQEAGSVNPTPNYSPIIGRMHAYFFLVRKLWPVLWFPIVNK